MLTKIVLIRQKRWKTYQISPNGQKRSRTMKLTFLQSPERDMSMIFAMNNNFYTRLKLNTEIFGNQENLSDIFKKWLNRFIPLDSNQPAYGCQVNERYKIPLFSFASVVLAPGNKFTKDDMDDEWSTFEPHWFDKKKKNLHRKGTIHLLHRGPDELSQANWES